VSTETVTSETSAFRSISPPSSRTWENNITCTQDL